MIGAVKAKGGQVLVLGIRIPPNYGKRFADLFQSLYPKLADETGSGLVPFFLEGVGGHDDMMQADGLHPNEKAQPILKSNVLSGLKTLGIGLDSTRQAPRHR
jgi:acyl-CoA thioesterase-1